MWLRLLFLCAIAAASSDVVFKPLDIQECVPNDPDAPTCNEYLCEMVNSAFEKKKLWAVKMVDSWSKLPSGIIEGNMQDYGSFDECLRIVGKSKNLGLIHGKYCLGDVKIKEFPVRFGICVPDKCNSSDLSEFMMNNIEDVENSTFTKEYCQTKDSAPEYTAGDIIVILFFSVILLIVLFSTLYDLFLDYTDLLPYSDFLLAYSLWTNGRKLFSITENRNDHLNCLNGIRSLTMMWILLAHGYNTKLLGGITNTKDVDEWYKNYSSMTILGSTVAVDTFFLLGGIVLVYVYMKSKMKGNVYQSTLSMYIHRYVRLTPAVAALILIHVTLIKHMGSGPVWPKSYPFMMKFCKEYWWSLLLYVQNYVNPQSECIGQTWYLCVDMQLFILSPIILIPLKKYPKYALSGLILLTSVSMGGIFYTACYYNLRGIERKGPPESITKYYVTTHTRAPPYLIGMIVGYFIYLRKCSGNNFKINKKLNMVLWIASLIVLFTCTFAGKDLLNTVEYQKYTHVIYLTFLRPSWAVALSWVIFACVTDNGGLINKFLSMSIFQVLSRLTYGMFLIHYSQLSVCELNQRIRPWFSDGSLLLEFWYNFAITFLLAVALCLTFESPIIILEKCIRNRLSGNYQPDGNSMKETINIVIPRIIPVPPVDSPYTEPLKWTRINLQFVTLSQLNKIYQTDWIRLSAQFGLCRRRIMWLRLLFLCATAAASLDVVFKPLAMQECVAKDPNAPTCNEYLCEMVYSAFEKNRLWAVKMVDAWSKLPPGIIEGNMQDLGSYDECLGIGANNSNLGLIYGKYCLGDVKLKGFPVRFAICVPDKCTTSDLNEFIKNNIEDIENPAFTDEYCQTKDGAPEYTAGDITVIVFFVVILFIALCSTFYDMFLDYTDLLPYSEFLLTFSLWTNGRKLFTITGNRNDHLSCLNGIRTLSMMWVILGHGYNTKLLGGITNMRYVDSWFKLTSSMMIVGATVAVDTFFLLSGIVLVYVYMRTKIQGNVFLSTLSMYIHRYVRLTPALAALLLIHVTLLKHMGNGPFWPRSYPYMIQFCNEYWWSVLLYVQNYVNSDRECIGQSWYLSVDMQLFILSPIILIPLKKFPKYVLSGLVLLTAISMGGTFYIACYYNLRGLEQIGNMNTLTKYYVTTHTRAPPYLIGMIVGYFIYLCKRPGGNFKINKILNVVLWLASLTVLFACTFAGTDLLNAEDYQKYLHASYLTFVRPSWAVALSWVVFSCVTDNGGLINKFLSMPIFQVMSRLTYSMYLIHYTLLSIFVLSQRTAIRFSDGALMLEFWSNFAITFFLAVALSLTFESPIIVLEKCIRNRLSGNYPSENNSITETINIVIPRINPAPPVDSPYTEPLK
ncbi:PREDICTED: uncharacterized protein LOC108566646 [Nicrophorus vespilloides]|uniref:Uncharacterized protein LOC108566646 n=1 Tax=Nicrophorus vespilloides TaxID=110193 RepID=A0ABM1N5M6_NICVS|nr:PREDICTED: uncharacterized protein LOC108566646 [Nicrophorus vespilloides]